MAIKPEPIQRNEVIKQLVSQQFYIHPNFITDRTHRLKIEIQGAASVYSHFTDYLYKISYNLIGIKTTPYNEVLEKVAKVLHISSELVKRRFYDKTHVFINEGLATEDILYITFIASILETLDVQHFEELVDNLYDSYVKMCIEKIPVRNDSNLTKHFNAGIKRLGEIADSHFSLLHNIIKCNNLARLFNIKITYDQSVINDYYQIVINGIISGGI